MVTCCLGLYRSQVDARAAGPLFGGEPFCFWALGLSGCCLPASKRTGWEGRLPECLGFSEVWPGWSILGAPGPSREAGSGQAVAPRHPGLWTWAAGHLLSGDGLPTPLGRQPQVCPIFPRMKILGVHPKPFHDEVISDPVRPRPVRGPWGLVQGRLTHRPRRWLGRLFVT